MSAWGRWSDAADLFKRTATDHADYAKVKQDCDAAYESLQFYSYHFDRRMGAVAKPANAPDMGSLKYTNTLLASIVDTMKNIEVLYRHSVSSLFPPGSLLADAVLQLNLELDDDEEEEEVDDSDDEDKVEMLKEALRRKADKKRKGIAGDDGGAGPSGQ